MIGNGNGNRISADALRSKILSLPMTPLVMSRGVARLVELAELTLPYAAVGGVVVAAKGPDIDSELEEASWAAGLLGAAPAISTTVPEQGTSGANTMVYWMKIDRTPNEYPRRNGIPHLRPLLRPAPRRRGESGVAQPR